MQHVAQLVYSSYICVCVCERRPRTSVWPVLSDYIKSNQDRCGCKLRRLNWSGSYDDDQLYEVISSGFIFHFSSQTWKTSRLSSCADQTTEECSTSGGRGPTRGSESSMFYVHTWYLTMPDIYYRKLIHMISFQWLHSWFRVLQWNKSSGISYYYIII